MCCQKLYDLVSLYRVWHCNDCKPIPQSLVFICVKFNMVSTQSKAYGWACTFQSHVSPTLCFTSPSSMSSILPCPLSFCSPYLWGAVLINITLCCSPHPWLDWWRDGAKLSVDDKHVPSQIKILNTAMVYSWLTLPCIWCAGVKSDLLKGLYVDRPLFVPFHSPRRWISLSESLELFYTSSSGLEFTMIPYLRAVGG